MTNKIRTTDFFTYNIIVMLPRDHFYIGYSNNNNS